MNKLSLTKIIPVFILSLVFTGTAIAQTKGGQKGADREKRIEQLKISFITNELDLTSEEAQTFWPVYNEMSDKIRTEKKMQHTKTKELKTNNDSFSENDFKKNLNEILESEDREIQVKKEYTEKIAGIISYKKAVKLLSLEQRFKRELLSKLKKQSEGRPDHRSGGQRQRAPNRHE